MKDRMIDGNNILTFSGLVAIFGLLYKVNKDSDSKVKRVYKRIDEIKDKNDNTYTHKDVCEIRHQQLCGDVSEIKSDVKSLLRKNGIK